MKSASLPFLIVLLLLGSGLLSCASSGGAVRDSAAPAETGDAETLPEDLDRRALLLLLVDRQIYEPYTVEQALGGDEASRRALAVALGRIPDERALPVLVSLLGDPSPGVRREAAFALGLHDPGESRRPLLRATRDPDRGVGRLAVEALARHGAPLGVVREALGELEPAEARNRLLPSLFRFRDEGRLAVAASVLEDGDPDLAGRALYAVARNALPEAAPLLRSRLRDPDPWVRGWAARGLGKVGAGSDVELLRPLLEDPEAGPVVQALRAAARLVVRGETAAPAGWRNRVLELTEDSRAGVRITAVKAAEQWLLDPVLGRRLVDLAREGHPRERQLAFLALAGAEDPRARDLLPRFRRPDAPALRSAAARAAGLLGRLDLLRELRSDPDPEVRIAALATTLQGLSGENAPPDPIREALADPDPALRAVALEWLEEHPVAPFATLVTAFQRAGSDRIDDARRAAIRALKSRAEATPPERDSVIQALQEIARYPEYLIRRDAADALADLGRPRPEPGPAIELLPLESYRERILLAREPRRVRMETERGAVEIRLECPTAPLTCLNFLSLAGQGFYDGLSVHRVVPDFVVQDGDPRGDGWGGPGYAIRDELNRIRFDRGVVGMALSGPDSGGSQFFVTLSRQPHLNGSYTAFGRVTAGMEVLERILQEDEIVRIREIP
ncbi:MAG: peptidylprolyl isomerase [Thermoanaerobaculia bacterium]|nr:peptidylprolyl isomerase [Thermoanaerobaculia bacterium]